MCYQCLIALVGTLWDTQGWSPRTLPAFPHFNTSLTNELMDFCRSIWWICAGGSPDFLTDRCPELVYGSGIHAPKPKPRRFSPRPKHDLRLLEHLVSAFHMIHPKYALVSVDGLFSHRWFIFLSTTCSMIMTIIISGNQFPIMNTLSCDWSEQGWGLRNCPNFLRYFQSVAQSGLVGARSLIWSPD